MGLTLLCTGYLSFLCFDTSLDPEDVRLYISLGYYGFLEYAYAYWSRHLDKALSCQLQEDALREVSEAVAILIDMYWTEPQTKITTPKSVLGRIKLLQKDGNSEKIATAVHIARKQLYPSTKVAPEEHVLKLHQVVQRIRSALEDHASAAKDPGKFRLMYGSHIFKCPRVNCCYFYNGFTSKQERDDHEPKHERSYFCSFPGCHFAVIGCATLAELRKHDNDFHGMINLNDDAEYPELPPEKTSFDCPTCGATFTRKHNLNTHNRLKHGGPNVARFVCKACGKNFGRQGDWTRHETTAHSDAKSFVCGGVLKSGSRWGCGRVFNRGDTLNRHWKSKHGQACLLTKQAEEASESSTPLGPSTQTFHD